MLNESSYRCFFLSSVDGGGVSTLVACELLSDVHELCAKKDDCGELVGLRKYLVQDRGWRCLAVLHLLGVRGLSCGRELVALLVALYPVALQENTDSDLFTSRRRAAEPRESSICNRYVRFHRDDDTVDMVDIVPYITKHKSGKSSRNGSLYEDIAPSRRRSVRKHQVGAKLLTLQHKQQKSSILEARRNTFDATSSESEPPADGIDQARSLTLKIRLNPMDFEYFTSVVRSGDEEQKWQAELYELPPRPVRKTPRDYIDERVKDVLDTKISNFEISLLIMQLLQGLRDYDTPAEQTPAVQVLKFALDTLWSLQFGTDNNTLSGTECAMLKAAAARLMLMALERALRADEPTTAVIHNGLVPMMLRLLEDACGKPVNVLESEQGSLLQEFIFAIIYGIVTFLYCLLHQRSSNVDKLSDFRELFQLFVESQDGKLVERTIFAIVDLPCADSAKSIVRVRKIIDMIGVLTGDLKRIRRDLSHDTECHRTKHRSCIDNVQTHHHSNVLGIPYSRPIDSVNKYTCCISSLFAMLANLLKESHLFVNELQVRLIKVITSAGTCCCFPPKILVSSFTSFLKKRDFTIYAPAVIFLERTLFKELGAYSMTDVCGTCDRSADYSWDFLEMYVDLLNPSDSKLCYVVMAHLLKVTPNSRFCIREQLLLKIFYPTFLRAKKCYAIDSDNQTAKFLVQSCMSVISCLIVNAQICEKFMEMNGLQEILPLIADTAFTRNVYALLEITVIIEIWRISRAPGSNDTENIELPATKSLLESLDRETNELLKSIEKFGFVEDETNQSDEKDTSHHSQEVESSPVEDLKAEINETVIESAEDETIVPRLPENVTHSKQLEDKTDDTIDVIVDSNSSEKLHTFMKRDVRTSITDDTNTIKCSLYQASAVWRAAAGVALCSSKFRIKLSAHPVSRKSLRLCKLLAVGIATDSIEGRYNVIQNDTSKQLLYILMNVSFRYQ